MNQQDIAGFALISGTDENAGKYVDRDGNVFRRQGNQMIAEDSGAAVAVREYEEEGEVIGHIEKTVPYISGPLEAEEQAAAEAALVAEASGAGPDVSVLVGEPVPADPVVDAAHEEKVSSLLADMSPVELELMAAKLAESDPSIQVAQGGDEAAARANADVIAKNVTE